jgi:pimeloyl-ACP methyl ester carboxylesterase
MVHGLTWNRLGTAPRDVMVRLAGSSPVELLKPARTLHNAGYHLLMFDLRNHGHSGSSPTVTFGHDEARDVLGALGYLQGREDVDADRIGVVGYCMGANAALFACASTQSIKAAIAAQPVRPYPFAHRMASALLGPLGGVALSVARRVYYNAGGPLWETTDPTIVADLVSSTATMYIQGDGDPWGDVPSVRRLCEMAQEPKVLKLVPSTHRFGGYHYLGENPEMMLEFFETHLAANSGPKADQ